MARHDCWKRHRRTQYRPVDKTFRWLFEEKGSWPRHVNHRPPHPPIPLENRDLHEAVPVRQELVQYRGKLYRVVARYKDYFAAMRHADRKGRPYTHQAGQWVVLGSVQSPAVAA